MTVVGSDPDSGATGSTGELSALDGSRRRPLDHQEVIAHSLGLSKRNLHGHECILTSVPHPSEFVCKRAVGARHDQRFAAGESAMEPRSGAEQFRAPVVSPGETEARRACLPRAHARGSKILSPPSGA